MINKLLERKNKKIKYLKSELFIELNDLSLNFDFYIWFWTIFFNIKYNYDKWIDTNNYEDY